jgi:hypothetical protein
VVVQRLAVQANAGAGVSARHFVRDPIERHDVVIADVAFEVHDEALAQLGVVLREAQWPWVCVEAVKGRLVPQALVWAVVVLVV